MTIILVASLKSALTKTRRRQAAAEEALRTLRNAESEYGKEIAIIAGAHREAADIYERYLKKVEGQEP